MLGKRTLAGQYNTKTASISDFKIDKVGPTMTTVSFKKADNSAYTPGSWSIQNIIQTLSGNDNGGSGVSYFQYSENSGAATNTASGESWSAERNSKVKFRAVDAVGNVGAWTTEYNLKIDKTAPTQATFSSPYNGVWATTTYTISISASDNMSGISYYQYSTNGGASWATQPNPRTVYAQENYTVYFRAVNGAGLAGAASAACRVMVDTTPPSITGLSFVSIGYMESAKTTARPTVKETVSDPESGIALSSRGNQDWGVFASSGQKDYTTDWGKSGDENYSLVSNAGRYRSMECKTPKGIYKFI